VITPILPRYAARYAVALATSLLPLAPALAVDLPHVGECVDCHGGHGTFEVNQAEAACRSCHFAGGPASEMEVGSHARSGSTSGIACGTCHDPHEQQPIVGKFLRAKIEYPVSNELVVDFAGGGFDALCLACHGQGPAPTEPFDWGASKHGAAGAELLGPATAPTGFQLLSPYASALRGSYTVACLTCHGPHAGPIPSLVRPVVNVAPVSVGADGKILQKTLCNSCHQENGDRHHTADAAGKVGTVVSDCTSCHPLLWDPVRYTYYFDMNTCTTSSCHGHATFF